MNTRGCYLLSILICLFSTSIPAHALLVPWRMLPKKALNPPETTLSKFGKSFGSNALGLLTSGLIIGGFCLASSKHFYNSDAYIGAAFLTSFAGGSLANFCAYHYPKETAIVYGSLAALAISGLAICYSQLDLLSISNGPGFFSNYPPLK